MFTFTTKSKRRRRHDRKGTAAVEAAICIPVVMILLLGTLEVSSGIYLRESLSICSFEAVRQGVRRNATRDDVYDRAVQALADRGVSMEQDEDGNYVGIEIEPADFSGLPEMAQIQVRITASTQGNSIFIFDNFYERNITSSAIMVREYGPPIDYE